MNALSFWNVAIKYLKKNGGTVSACVQVKYP